MRGSIVKRQGKGRRRGKPIDLYYIVYQVGKRYQMVMRGMYVPFESRQQIEQVTALHRQSLGIPVTP